MSEVAKQWWPSTIYAAPEETIEPLHIVWINKSGDTDPYVTVTKADTLQYSYDNANWVNASSANISGSQMDGSSEYHVYIRRRPDLAPTTALFSSLSVDNKWTINEGQARLSGNIMSLLGQDEEVGEYAFGELFYYNSNLIDASELEMPAMKLGAYCYAHMFIHCTALTAAPALPAMTLAEGCYAYMFHYCTALATAPALPATTLATLCYDFMFYNCTALTSVPTLPATVMAKSCYSYMFCNCKGLEDIPAGTLPAMTLAESCYKGMFQRTYVVPAADLLPATVMAPSCYMEMFEYADNFETAPNLPATVMAPSCYESMFNGCSIRFEVTLHATVLAAKCCRRMFYGCGALEGVDFTSATDISAIDALDQWLKDTAVSGSGTLYVSSAMLKEWKKNGEVPNNWSIVAR